MAIKGEGPWVIGAMWSLTAVAFVFVVLRAYTRIFVVKSFGIDDHVYNLAWIFLLLDTVFTTVAVDYGVGRDMDDVIQNNPSDLAPALIFEAVSQSFAIMKMKEKIVILSSLSLGVIAGAFGIKRTLEVPKLKSPNHTKDPVGLIVWSAAEMTVTMICIGIPVCRPLYKKYFSKWSSRNSSKYQQNSGASFPLQTIGGSIKYPAQVQKKDSASEASVQEYERKGVGSSYGKNKVFANGAERYVENQSEEEILGPDFRRSQREDIEARYY
ncbi:integral membrane protein pth11 [Fusarium napiforme]|uniref:Integral membrane protein pth11 n=1 Tax=Fusarium napiforme TaxID=42672 RepID=A0A8H5MVV3_9HYPO|nr:integral membrane protein pth11 [Fusarium napiforme]